MPYEMNYCLSCGVALELKTVEQEEPPRHVCTQCSRVHYENPLPTAGAFIMNDGKVLLVRRAVEPFKGYWDVPGGFLEKHEHPVDGLHREMKEELGIEIDVHDLLGIFMGNYESSDVSTLNIYYAASISSGIPEPRSDIDKAEWFPIEDIPELAFPQNADAVAMMKKYLAASA